MAPTQQTTVGYPHIEKLIDSEDFNGLNKAFADAYEKLEKVYKDKKGMGKGKEAAKAMRALEKCSELLKELLKVKYHLKEQIAKQAKK
ncbi:MAG: hypothetical protein A2W61_05360 [Deltaproteobacteria bacterium RIFCSPLOWO2_01_44_7]|nr:MAG: hypothetical protein A2712_10850 [Deltaproteobacteria bacterium RIFCSPHIGHO2_01_FULL_43_49]OGQ16552.1 MAG: hypothetical protein A3D22_06550 [Deltaproteobacteria bacterium RIFCSPHIGHO2_02_FULL_44_53]OGQ28368.1 MAG: hypothetical protein A3D98_06255 [Deltaproteobacteria bacterium RIFCSPHIGHO2_12_FULL_44_21]OGQ32440.1 MAG: hypothetical protein A2979_10815 [Deltaproteobacteria bacterium RIFCSPLOWO2_01_FULL_45_74]OGQ38112.1 MAG: hypothetical protein A2W61_05360 [Deltaproteobacteria bacterium 